MASKSKGLTVKNVTGQAIKTTFQLAPAIAGGAVGAGIGRPSLLIGAALMGFAAYKGWPVWVQSVGMGMAVNGVATTFPLNSSTPSEVSVTPSGELQGFNLVPDNFQERSKQYLSNVLMNTYLDKVPVVNKMLGLGSLDASNMFAAKQTSKITMPESAKQELSRIMGEFEQGSMGNIDAYEVKQIRSSGIAGIDAAEFKAARESISLGSTPGMQAAYMR